jgi:hypothetical protein
MSEPSQLPKTNIDPAGPAVTSFLRCNALSATPEFIEFEDHGYEENQCHISVKHKVIASGGQRIHGWALWEFEQILIGEFHSVWERPDGMLIDVTPPKFGAAQVLFVRDPACKIEFENGAYLIHTDRTSRPDLPFVFRGEPSDYSHWLLPPTHPDLVRYCAKLGLPDTSLL